MAQNELNTCRLVVIGGSAGSLEVVLKIIAALPARMQASVLVVLHRKNAADSPLVHIFSSRTSLPVKEVEDKETLLPGTIYLAPADYHLLLEDAQNFSLDSSEKVHYSRPSIDITFDSAAEIFGSQCVGLLLSGANADGAQGLLSIKKQGGFTIAQDPATAEVSFMPQQAILVGAALAIISAEELPAYISKLVSVSHQKEK